MSTQERAVKAIATIAGVKPADVQLGDALDGKLGLDSLDKIEVVMELEDEFDIELDEEELEKCVTAGDVVALVERVVG